MIVLDAVRRRLSLKIALKLAVLLLALTGLAGAYITWTRTEQMEEATLEKARLAASLGARQYGETFDNAIDSGLLTVADVFDRAYVEIKGFSWGGKPKFHTRYDSFTDRAVLVFQDRFLDSEDFVFAVGVDVKGYLPTHNTRFQAPVTGVPEKDLAGNRTKRMFDDPVGAKAAANTEPSLKQEYRRDTGEVMWDVSSPIMVKGKHWGGFRIGVSMDRIEARKRTLIATLAGIFGIFVLVTIGAMLVVVEQAMGPVRALTASAHALSLGDEMDQPIGSEDPDEIGRLARAVERLRISLKAAMSRLGG
jgi:HAMP domain-containing protein